MGFWSTCFGFSRRRAVADVDLMATCEVKDMTRGANKADESTQMHWSRDDGDDDGDENIGGLLFFFFFSARMS